MPSSDMGTCSVRRQFAGLIVVAVTLSGCGDATQVATGASGRSAYVTPTDSASAAGPGSPSPRPSEPAGGSSAQPLTAERMLAIATADLATRIGVPVADISVLRNDAVTWPDGGLGCPKKGMAYISVLTPGQLIVLAVGGSTYEYHAARRTPPFLCENPQPPLPGPGEA